MEDGQIEVEASNDDSYVSRVVKKRTFKDFIPWILLAVFVIFIVTFAIYTNVHDKQLEKQRENEFQTYFGGYETAQEYVNNLVYINNISVNKNAYLSNYYGLKITITNKSNKSIKYFRIKVQAYNSVNDKIAWNGNDENFRGVGPIDFDKDGLYKFDNYYSGSTISKFEITYFELEYMDETKVVFNDAMLVCINK